MEKKVYDVGYLRGEDYASAASELGVSVAVIKAVASVEARKSGFLARTDLPHILFEGHHFHSRTGGKYHADYPSLSYPRWTSAHYKGGRGEYDRLTKAIEIHGNPDPALLSTSWGMFQIMGFNFDACGHVDVKDFVNDLSTGEPAQLRAFTVFLKTQGLVDALRSRDWDDFARQYNGPLYRRNAYHTKMAAAFAREVAKAQELRTEGRLGLERGDVVAVQTALNVMLGDELGEQLVPDGWFGEKTARAIRLFQRKHALSETGKIDDPNLLEALDLEDLAAANRDPELA